MIIENKSKIKKDILNLKINSKIKNIKCNNSIYKLKSKKINEDNGSNDKYNNLENKTFYLKRKNESDKFIENLENTEDAYNFVKKMNFSNKGKVFQKIEDYYNSKGYNIQKIKKNIKKKELFNFLDNIEKEIDKYDLNKEIKYLYYSIHKQISEKKFEDFEEISHLNKTIQTIENMYYLSLLKNQS